MTPPSDQTVAALLAALDGGDFDALYGLADRLEELGEQSMADDVRRAIDVARPDVTLFRSINSLSTDDDALRTIRRRRCLGVLLSFRRIG